MANITLTNTLTNGATADADEVMENFNDIVNEVNGSLDNTNIATDASIAVSKINSTGAFLSTPSSAPTTDYQVANKKYVDDEITEESTITTTIASSATPTPARASRKTMYVITALTETATFGAPTGTPKLGDALLIWAKSSAAAERTLNWNAIYKDGSTKRPTKTLASTTKYVKILYIFDGTDWRCDFEGSDI